MGQEHQGRRVEPEVEALVMNSLPEPAPAGEEQQQRQGGKQRSFKRISLAEQGEEVEEALLL